MTTKIRKPREPKLRRRKASGRYKATFSNPANLDPETGSIESWLVWFGPDKRDAERRFRAYLARWDASDYHRPVDDSEGPAVSDLTVRDLVDRYRVHVRQRRGEGWWRKNRGRFELAIGTTTGRGAVGDSPPLLAEHADEGAASFGSPELVALFEAMAAAGNLCQNELNARLDIVRALFKGAA